jgi:hypothetical protein
MLPARSFPILSLSKMLSGPNTFEINDIQEDETESGSQNATMLHWIELRSMEFLRTTTLRTHCVLVVMDQCTRRIIGFFVHAGTVDSVALCSTAPFFSMPNYFSSDNDPLYKVQQWRICRYLRWRKSSPSPAFPCPPEEHSQEQKLVTIKSISVGASIRYAVRRAQRLLGDGLQDRQCSSAL